nr:nose resistant to fluoxetine protein 6-like [Parasteatoda tepidariorum]
MSTLSHNSKCLECFIFILISLCFIQNSVSQNLSNRSAFSSVLGAKTFCEKSDSPATDEFEKSDLNNASFVSLFFKNFLNSNTSNQCKDSLVIYLNEVINLKPWAIEMLDASGKISSSIFSITMVDYGSLDDCIKVKATSNDGEKLFKGKFCMVHLKHPLFQTPNRNPLIGKSYGEAFGVPPEWIRHHIESHIPLRFAYHGGICLPSTCTDEEVENVISTLVEPLDLDAILTDCQIEEPLEVPISAILCMIFFGTVLFACICGTVLDLNDRKMKKSHMKYSDESFTKRLLKAFSLYTNTVELFTENSNQASLNCAQGLRVILCFVILWAHLIMFPTPGKEIRYKNFHFVYEVLDPIVENNGVTFVDCFFTLSAFLLSYHTWRAIEQSKGHLNVFRIVLHRYCRLTLQVATLALLYLILPILSSGPIWKSSWESELENCYHNGWKNVLQIQNYDPLNEICLVHTWFMANTMQHLVISLPLMIVIYRYRKAGIFMGLLLFFVPCFYYGYQLLKRQYPFLSFNSLILVHVVDEAITLLYSNQSYHLPAHMIGMLSGWVCLKYGKKKLPKIWVITGWIFSILCFIAVTGAVFLPIKDLRIITFYNIGRISAMAFITSWILYSCEAGHGGNIYFFIICIIKKGKKKCVGDSF